MAHCDIANSITANGPKNAVNGTKRSANAIGELIPDN